MGRTGPYLAAGRPGPGSRGPSGAGSPSGRRGRRLWAERAQARKWLSEQVLFLQSAAPRPSRAGSWEHPFSRGWQPQDNQVCSPRYEGKPGEGEPGCSARPGPWALGSAPSSPRPTAPLPGPGRPPQPPLRTHCLQAGAHAPPETGSRGASVPPLPTRGSWIHTERQRGAAAGTSRLSPLAQMEGQSELSNPWGQLLAQLKTGPEPRVPGPQPPGENQTWDLKRVISFGDGDTDAKAYTVIT